MTPTTEELIKPCPLCGGDADSGFYAAEFVIGCPACCLHMSGYNEDPEEAKHWAIRKWNARPDAARVVALEDALIESADVHSGLAEYILKRGDTPLDAKAMFADLQRAGMAARKAARTKLEDRA